MTVSAQTRRQLDDSIAAIEAWVAGLPAPAPRTQAGVPQCGRCGRKVKEHWHKLCGRCFWTEKRQGRQLALGA